MSTPEGRIKDKVKRRLISEFPKRYVFMPVQNGMGAPALDMYCCFPGQDVYIPGRGLAIAGLFVAIETKAPGKRLTTRQEDTKQRIEEAGGLVYVVDGDDAIENMILSLRSILG
jgi:hypothetical protein